MRSGKSGGFLIYLAEQLGIDSQVIEKHPDIAEDVILELFNKKFDGPIPVFFLEDVHTFIKDLKLPDDVLSFLNALMNLVAQNKVILITTVSEIGETDCFNIISGSSRLDKYLYEGPTDDAIVGMLVSKENKINIIEEMFPDEKNREHAAKYIAMLIGHDMLSIQKIFRVFKEKKKINHPLPTNQTEIEKFIEECLPLKQTFFSLMDNNEVEPELKLMAQFLMQCASCEPNNQLYLTDEFFERFQLGEKTSNFFFQNSQRKISF